jgi:four helix bundle protein
MVPLTNAFTRCGRCCALHLIVRQPPELVGRAYRFSLAALRFYRKLAKSPDAQVPGVQFYKSATSTWANYRAAQRGRSRAEFIAKLGTAVEESDEAVGWLEFMRDGEVGSDSALLAEAKEICAMLTASLTNARNRGTHESRK